MEAVKSLLIIIQIIVTVGLIILIMSQTTKNEGLSGTIGGKSESSMFRGKPGAEDKMKSYTQWTAIAFIVTSAIVGLWR